MPIPLFRDLRRVSQPTRRRLRGHCLTWLGRREDAVVQFAHAINGQFGKAEVRLLYRAVRVAPGPGDIAEIGCWKGRTTVIMALALKELEAPWVIGREGARMART